MSERPFVLPSANIVQLLAEIKSEISIGTIIAAPEFDTRLLKHCISYAAAGMCKSFCIDCTQHTPHINYLKTTPMLRVTITATVASMNRLLNEFTVEDAEVTTRSRCHSKLIDTMSAVVQFLEKVDYMKRICHSYVDAASFVKFHHTQLIPSTQYETYIKFGDLCLRHANGLMESNDQRLGDDDDGIVDIVHCIRCADCIFMQTFIWHELNQNKKYKTNILNNLSIVYGIIKRILVVKNSTFLNKYEPAKNKLNCALMNIDDDAAVDASTNWYEEAVVVAKFVEIKLNATASNEDNMWPSNGLASLQVHF